MGKLSLSEQLCYVTTRIEASNDRVTSTGTGFFFNLKIDKNKNVPLLVTNKHVVKGKTKGCFLFTKADSNDNPLIGETFGIKYDVDFENQWIFHPDANVDICVLPINKLQIAATQLGHKLFYRALGSEHIPTEEISKTIEPIEDVYMIGYPNGLWDKKNNMAIIRKGLTATPYSIDFNGNKQFLIDMSVYPGSSGSPILLYDNGFTSRNGTISIGGNHIWLLGIVFQVFQRCITGDVNIESTPIASVKLTSSSFVPINLGIVIKAERLLDFISIFNK